MSKQKPAQDSLLNLIADCVAVLNMQIKRESGEWIVDNDMALSAWQGALERGIATLRKNNHDINAADRYAAPVETIAAPPLAATWVPAPQADNSIRTSLPRAMESMGRYTVSPERLDTTERGSMHQTYGTSQPRYIEPRANTRAPGREVDFDAAQTLLERLTNQVLRREEE